MSDLKKRLHQIACCEGECRENRIEAWERIAAMQTKLDEVDCKWHERFREQANYWHERTAMLRKQLEHLTEMVATQSALAPRTYIINKKHKPEALNGE